MIQSMLSSRAPTILGGESTSRAVSRPFYPPDVAEDEVSGITAEEMESAETIITNRLVNKNITNYEIYTDNENHQIIVRFPWQSDNEDYNPRTRSRTSARPRLSPSVRVSRTQTET